MEFHVVIDMLNVTVFKVFYGPSEVRHSSYGTDLCNFAVTSLEVENPEGYKMKQMLKRLTRWFQLDMERYSVRVELLYCWPSSPSFLRVRTRDNNYILA
uniref:Uncharacterized protein n=1 Tax=Arundo donax TaxID=35708 RepID=A0A0A9ANS8_ARUDO